MPVKHEIEIIITPEGEVKLDIRGMAGPSCGDAIKQFASGLGEVKAVEKKAEFYQASQSQSRTQRRT